MKKARKEKVQSLPLPQMVPFNILSSHDSFDVECFRMSLSHKVFFNVIYVTTIILIRTFVQYTLIKICFFMKSSLSMLAAVLMMC